MTPVIRISRKPNIRAYATEFKLGLRDAVKVTSRGITRRVIDITPPANGESTGADAYRVGRVKIANQMSSVMVPVRLKGRRRITMAWGRKMKRPVFVPTKEKYPDVAGLYRSRLKASSSGFGLVTRQGAKAYVDVRKFQAVLKERQGNVGKLAAGWNAAASALDVPVQAWISRHGMTGGRVQIDLAGNNMRVTVENLAPRLPAPIRAELARRIPYAVMYQANAMERAIDGHHQRVKRQLRIGGVESRQ